MAQVTSSSSRDLAVLFRTGSMAGLSDRQLLERYARGEGDPIGEAAFAALMARHGAMVLGVCRKILGDYQLAEDAFQAVFLVLARRAQAIGDPDLLGNWLYGVAIRTARCARRQTARRRRREEGDAMKVTGAGPPADGRAIAREQGEALHDAIARLPRAFRVPVVLCYFEGLTVDEAARHLRCPAGTIQSRLARARTKLRRGLARRGVVFPAAALTAFLAPRPAPASITPGLCDSTIRAAIAFAARRSAVGGATSAPAAALAQEVLNAMLIQKRLTLPTLLLVGLMAAGAGFASWPAAVDRAQTGPAEPRPESQPKPVEHHDDRGAIQGTWATSQAVTSVRAGQPLPPKDVPIVWAIDGDRITESIGSPTEDGGVQEHIMRFALNPSATPKAIDLSSIAYGPNKGIYQLAGDTLTVCYGFEDRPTAFRDGGEPGPVLLVFKRAKATAQRASARFSNAEACEWALFPTGISGTRMMSGTRGGLVLSVDHAAGAPLRVSLAHPGRRADAPAPEYIAVAFDATGRRYPLTASGSGSGGDPRIGPTVALHQFTLDPKVLPADRATHLGIEVVTPEAHDLAARSAQAKARAAGVEVLPIPLLGRPFDFTLTTVDGKPIRSGDLRGKVILIDCWATWCSPCMAKMPALKDMYDQRHGDGLEIIGISFDEKPEAARKAVRSLGLAWPQVLVPADETVRTFWKEASQVAGLPRLFLVDRRGVLRWGGGPGDLPARVGTLLDERSEP